MFKIKKNIEKMGRMHFTNFAGNCQFRGNPAILRCAQRPRNRDLDGPVMA